MNETFHLTRSKRILNALAWAFIMTISVLALLSVSGHPSLVKSEGRIYFSILTIIIVFLNVFYFKQYVNFYVIHYKLSDSEIEIKTMLSLSTVKISEIKKIAYSKQSIVLYTEKRNIRIFSQVESFQVLFNSIVNKLKNSIS